MVVDPRRRFAAGDGDRRPRTTGDRPCSRWARRPRGGPPGSRSPPARGRSVTFRTAPTVGQPAPRFNDLHYDGPAQAARARPERSVLMRAAIRCMAVALVLVMLAPAVGAHERGSGPSATQVVRARVIDFAFRPRNLTIAPGTVVRWVNRGARTHTTTSNT